MATNKNTGLKSFVVTLLKRFTRSVWVFPVILLVPLIVLSSLEISGSSIGTYHTLFYGNKKDPDLLLNRPQPIRSDEWLVNTQLTIAQKNNDFKRINKNIGNGQDMSLMVDVPYKEWSAIFKPHNLAFLGLPFDNAFAFKWWLMAYLLMVSCYFFVLVLLPGKRLLGSLLSAALFFSPFVQWWYLYGTLGVLYYSFFGAVILTKLLRPMQTHYQVFWALLLTYVSTCFILILYPPFQIPCALVMIAFSLGYSIENFTGMPRKEIYRKLLPIITSFCIAGILTFAFLATRSQAISTIKNTAYPGKRLQKSGGYDAPHLFSSHLGGQLQFEAKASHYSIPSKGLTNQSENSNFVLLLPFLLLPTLYLLYRYKKYHSKIDWPLLNTTVAYMALLAWMFIPKLDILGKFSLLEIVPHTRLLVGLGLLNVVQLVLFIRRYEKLKTFRFSTKNVLIYVVVVLLIELGLGIYVMDRLPGFIGIKKVIAFALPIATSMWLILRKHFVWGIFIMSAFAFTMTYRIHPLYRGTETLNTTPISTTIKQLSSNDDLVWANEVFLLENFVFMNGARSLSGVYSYPQLDLWRGADSQAKNSVYNRFAHTVFTFDRDSTLTIPTRLVLTGGDSFAIITEPCGNFLTNKQTGYILTASKLEAEDNCALFVKEVTYPKLTLYIYKLL